MVSFNYLTTIPTAVTAAAAAAAAGTTPSTSASTLNVTVIGAQDNKSTLECWALEPGFVESSEAGTAGTEVLQLGAVNGSASYSVLPARFDGGKHNAPALQWVIFLSGLAHITLPDSPAEAWIHGGKDGAILALDTAAVSADGHYTEYPSDEATVALQVPLQKQRLPEHGVSHPGACEGVEVGV